MSLITVIRRAATVLSLPQPATAVGSSDQTALALVEFARLDAEDLADKFDWPTLTRERSFTSVAAYNQPTALPSDFNRFTFRNSDRGEIWDAGRREGIAGPASDEQWRVLIDGFSGWTSTWRIFNGALQLAPTPGAGQTFSFNYITNAMYRPTSGTDKTEWSADTDTCLIPENVIALGAIWRWRKARGFDWEAERDEALMAAEKAMGKAAGGRRVLVVGRSRFSRSDVDLPFPMTVGP